MRLMMSALAFAATAFALPASEAAAQNVPRFAYVNTQVLMQQHPGRAAAETQFNQEMTAFQAQMQRMGDSLNVMIAAYQREEAGLAQAARDTRQAAIRERRESYERRAQELEEQLEQRHAALLQPIMEQVSRVLNELREAEGYTMIFDIGSQANPIVAADRNLDVTDRALARLRTAAASPQAQPQQQRPAAATPQPAGVGRPRPPR